MSRRIHRYLLVLAVLLLAAAAGAATATAASQNQFSGQATVVRANVLGFTTVLADTGPLPSGGGAQEASLLDASVPGLLTAEVFHATTVANDNHSSAEASIASLVLTVNGNTIQGDFLMSRAAATCSNGQASVSGSSELVGLVINGQSIAVTGQPNQTVALPVGQVIINEQSGSASGNSGSITVNALHVSIPGVADVVISSAHADITCASPPPPPPAACDKDFVTGGGWIAPSGSKDNFAVAGGIKNGAFWGHLEYQDKAVGLKVHGTGVTAYTVTGSTSRHIEGTATINGQPGTYKVDVADNGEPGRNDTFNLTLSNGYTAGGTLQGGNIQLHNCD